MKSNVPNIYECQRPRKFSIIGICSLHGNEAVRYRSIANMTGPLRGIYVGQSGNIKMHVDGEFG